MRRDANFSNAEKFTFFSLAALKTAEVWVSSQTFCTRNGLATLSMAVSLSNGIHPFLTRIILRRPIGD